MRSRYYNIDMPNNIELLDNGARELGIKLTSEQLAQFQTYYDELVEWNKKFNLTAITDYEDVIKKHFLDSITLITALSEESSLLITDVGTGAGFPGLPIKIALPHISLNLIEATEKKTAFLKNVVDKLGLCKVSIINSRAEKAGHNPSLRECSDVVVSRAVAEMSTLLELTAPFCKVGGVIIAQKKGDITFEMSEAKLALLKFNCHLEKTINVPDFGLGNDRKLVIVRKLAELPEKYPRRDGIPLKRPIK